MESAEKDDKCLYEGVIVLMTYEAVAWGITSAERRECPVDEVLEKLVGSVMN